MAKRCQLACSDLTLETSFQTALNDFIELGNKRLHYKKHAIARLEKEQVKSRLIAATIC